MCAIKKFIKYLFITIVTLFLIVVVFIMAFVGGDESDTKEDFGNGAINEITSFYNTNGHYPKSLHDLPIYKNQEFLTHIKNNAFSYSSLAGEKPTYIFSWRAGAMNWTGYSCTNDESTFNKNNNGVIRTYKRPDGSICRVTDLH